MENHYETLKISIDSDIEAIKKAYRNLAREVHPDKKQTTSEDFIRISKAYEVLSDPEKKEKYDKTLKPDKITRVYKYPPGTNLKISLKVKIDDLILGKTKNILTTRKGLCKTCNGTGSKNKTLKICPNCQGKGIKAYSLLRGSITPCTNCDGLGKVPEYPLCSDCNGKGLCPETVKKSIKLTPQHLSSQCVIVPGFGNYCLGGTAGDLLIELHIEPDPKFKIKGQDIESLLEISPAQAILGDKVQVDIHGLEEEIVIPPGTQNGHLLEKENAGFIHGNKKGNLFLRVRIRMPEKITNEEEKLYRQLLILEKNNGSFCTS